MNQGIWRGLGGGGVPFWLHRETLTFQGSCSIPNTAVFEIGVNKIPPKFDILFATSSPLSCYLIPLRPKYPPHHPVLKYPQPTFFAQCKQPSFTPGKITLLYILIFIIFGQQTG